MAGQHRAERNNPQLRVYPTRAPDRVALTRGVLNRGNTLQALSAAAELDHVELADALDSSCYLAATEMRVALGGRLALASPLLPGDTGR
jgi:hypothetical protein